MKNNHFTSLINFQKSHGNSSNEVRFEVITGYKEPCFTITPETDTECISKVLLEELGKVVDFLDSIEIMKQFIA